MGDIFGATANPISTANGYSTVTTEKAAGKPKRRWAAACVTLAALALAGCETTGRGPTLTGSYPAPQASGPAQPGPEAPQEAALPPDSAFPPAATTSPAGPVYTVRIGVLVPLSGEASSAGQALRDAALLAQFEVGNPGLILQFYDTQGTVEGAKAAAETAKAQGASLFIGPLFSQSVQAVTATAQSAGIPVLSFSSDASAANANIFVTGFLIPPQVDRIISYATEQGMQRYAILAPETAYGHAMTNAAQIAIARTGGVVVRQATFNPNKTNFSDVIRDLTDFNRRKAALEREKAKLAKAPDPASAEALKRLEKQDTLGRVDFDALFMPMAGTPLRQAISLLKYYDVDPNQVKLLGTLLWQDEALSQESAFHGAWFPAASRSGYEHFVARYTETYGRSPSQLASLAYDMVALAAALSRHGEQPWGYLTTAGGFIGVNGAFRLNPNGNIDRMLAVREIEPNGSRVISDAPVRFSLGN